MTSLAGSRRV